MPVHDWNRVDAGIFHDFHHAWIEEIKRALNGGLLPDDYYALPEQHAAGVGPDVITFQESSDREAENAAPGPSAEEPGFGNTVVVRHVRHVRHVSGDRVEVVSPGIKASRHSLRAFGEQAAGLLERRVHLLILDLHPPSRRDPNGIPGATWEEVAGEEFEAPAAKPLTLVAYEAGLSVRAPIEPLAVGDSLPPWPCS